MLSFTFCYIKNGNGNKNEMEKHVLSTALGVSYGTGTTCLSDDMVGLL